MQEQLVSFETAKLAKEKGFDWNCRYTYDNKGNLDSAIDWTGEETFSKENEENASKNGYNAYLASTQSLLQKWLREVHSIHVQISYRSNFGYWRVDIKSCKQDGNLLYRGKYNMYAVYTEALDQ